MDLCVDALVDVPAGTDIARTDQAFPTVRLLGLFLQSEKILGIVATLDSPPNRRSFALTW